MKFLILLVILINALIEARGEPRYLLYSVNFPEGFNLRRDVHMRAANLVRRLREKENWILVLPPWPCLYHWKSAVDQSWVPWRRFFDVDSLNRYIPSIEFEDFLRIEGNVIDEVIYLQPFAEGWGGEWEEKVEDRPCIDRPRYKQTSTGQWKGNVLGHTGVMMKSFRCVSVQGFASIMISELLDKNSHHRSVLLERFENLLHINYGGVEYWAARKSMVYAHHLREEGNRFMRENLGYDPGEGDGRAEPQGGGGRFLSVHLRRLDYLYAHPDVVPSLEGAAKQINQLKREQGLQRVFLTSDAPAEEKLRLKELIEGLILYKPSESTVHRYGDGGVSIIDQWIASHARYFIGTAESTFSFRIREDRQFMGFSQDSTFNNICGPSDNESDPHSCERPSYWKMVDVPEHLFSSDKTESTSTRTHKEL